MDGASFLELCYREYVYEKEEVEKLYTRGGAIVAGIALVGGLLYGVSPESLPSGFGLRFDISLYIIFMSLGLMLLVYSAIQIALALRPRDSERIAPMKDYLAWRESYQKQLMDMGYDNNSVEQAVSGYTSQSLLRMITSAHSQCKQQNILRFAHYDRSFRSLLRALGCVIVAGAFFLWINISNGVSHVEQSTGSIPSASSAPSTE